MLKITERAAKKALELALAENMTDRPLRVKVVGGGCAGFQYDMYFDDLDPLDMDETFESNGVVLVVDSVSMQYLDETEIDYVEELTRAGFKFNNPKAKGSCGCGSSFTPV